MGVGDITITITMTAAGQLQVSGAITNLPQAYGMLELAKDAIRAQAQRPASGIVPVSGVLNGH